MSVGAQDNEKSIAFACRQTKAQRPAGSALGSASQCTCGMAKRLAYCIAEVDTRAMRFRAIWAGLLAVLLLSLSPAASACEIKCDLAHGMPSCHGKAVAPGLQRSHTSPAEMAGMKMADVSREPTQHLGASEHDASFAPAACHHRVCAQSPMLMEDEGAQSAQVTLNPQAVHLIVTSLWSASPGMCISARRAPPLFPSHVRSTPVSLHTTLRV